MVNLAYPEGASHWSTDRTIQQSVTGHGLLTVALNQPLRMHQIRARFIAAPDSQIKLIILRFYFMLPPLDISFSVEFMGQQH